MNWLLVVSLACFALSIFSLYTIRRLNGEIKFTYLWGFLIGGFVWEDVFVFSLYFGFVSLMAYLVASVKLALLFFLVFWLVRSAGETLYFFLQQFIRPQHFPHDVDSHFTFLRRIFGKLSSQQCFIIMQVFLQSIMMASIVGILVLLFGLPT